MLKSLQSLRGIFALFIFLHHIGAFPAGGDSGVSFFIILSGFVMSAGYARKMEEGKLEYKPYILRRFRRIWPYHLIGFLLSIFFVFPFYGMQTPIIWIVNLAMLQSWIPSELYYFSCDSPSWCLSDLFFCYAAFPLLMRWKIRLGCNNRSRIPLTIFAGIYVIYFVVINNLPAATYTSLIYVNPLFRILDFIIGMALWDIFSSRKATGLKLKIDGLNRGILTAVELLILIVLGAGYMFYPEIAERYSLASYWWIPISLMILLFSANDRRGGIFTRLLHSKIAIYFGELSFAFYMLHGLFITAYVRIADKWGLLPPDSISVALILFLVTLLFSIFTEKIIGRYSYLLIPQGPNKD